MRSNFSVIALVLLAVTGCAHDRPNRKEGDAVPYTSSCCHACADAKPSGIPAQGPEPRLGAVSSAPTPPPAVTKPAVPSQSGLPPVQAAPALPDVVRPRELPDLPAPMPTPTVGEKRLLPPVISAKPMPLVRDSIVSPVPSKIPDVPSKPAPPKPAPPAQARPPVSAQPEQVLTGTIESWRRTQRLRYAPADVEEANGGLVTLVGDPQLERVKEGQRVRVHGFLIPSADRTHPPTFQVQSMEMVE